YFVVGRIETRLLRGVKPPENEMRRRRGRCFRESAFGGGVSGHQIMFVRLRDAVDRVVNRDVQHCQCASGLTVLSYGSRGCSLSSRIPPRSRGDAILSPHFARLLWLCATASPACVNELSMPTSTPSTCARELSAFTSHSATHAIHLSA